MTKADLELRIEELEAALAETFDLKRQIKELEAELASERRRSDKLGEKLGEKRIGELAKEIASGGYSTDVKVLSEQARRERKARFLRLRQRKGGMSVETKPKE